MPRNETIIGVFVASPSDVSEEREAFESIVWDLNKTWSKTLKLRLDLIKWDTDTYPGFGDYSQDVINDQINDEYDVFIAIFWSKVGTPTKMADSGTIEELERAYKKYKKNPDSVDLMVYFKDQAIPPSKMDPEQLKKIQELKEKLGEQGGLYWTFKSLKDFESLLRVHLSRIAQKWSAKLPDNGVQEVTLESEAEPNARSIEEGEGIEHDDGLLDYIEIYENKMDDMTAAFATMGDATAKIGDQFSRRTEEINSISNENGQTTNKQARRIINLASGDMSRYSEIMESQIKITSKSREVAFDALSKAISLSVEFKEGDMEDDFTDLEKSLKFLVESADGIMESLFDFREIISSLPRLTSHLNKSKRKTVKILNDVLVEVETIMQTTNDVLGIISEIKNA